MGPTAVLFGFGEIVGPLHGQKMKFKRLFAMLPSYSCLILHAIGIDYCFFPGFVTSANRTLNVSSRKISPLLPRNISFSSLEGTAWRGVRVRADHATMMLAVLSMYGIPMVHKTTSGF